MVKIFTALSFSIVTDCLFHTARSYSKFPPKNGGGGDGSGGGVEGVDFFPVPHGCVDKGESILILNFSVWQMNFSAYFRGSCALLSSSAPTLLLILHTYIRCPSLMPKPARPCHITTSPHHIF
jgi:hypothetical protein